MTKTRKLFFSAVGLALIAAVVAGIYQYQLERQRQSEEALALTETGIAQFQQNQYESAVETLRSIPEGTIRDWRPHYYLGAALVQLRDYEAAVASLEEAFRLNEQEESIAFALGVAYFKLGNLGLSKGYFHAALQINPENLLVLLAYGHLLEGQKRYSEAVALYRDCLKLETVKLDGQINDKITQRIRVLSGAVRER